MFINHCSDLEKHKKLLSSQYGNGLFVEPNVPIWFVDANISESLIYKLSSHEAVRYIKHDCTWIYNMKMNLLTTLPLCRNMIIVEKLNGCISCITYMYIDIRVDSVGLCSS